MREVQTICPQCEIPYSYFKPEMVDYADGHVEAEGKKCPNCGYPEVRWLDR